MPKIVLHVGFALIRSSAHVYSLTAAAASKDLGYDVKELGRDQSRRTAYLDANRD